MAAKLINIGDLLIKYVTIPILVIFIFFIVKYVWNGFSASYRFYKNNGRFMNDKEKQEWVDRDK